MAIDSLHDYALKAVSEKATPSRITSAKQAQPSVTSVENQAGLSNDDVVITAAAKTLTQATAMARKSDGIDHNLVAEIKKQLAEGTFKFDDEATAEMLLSTERDLVDLLG